MVISLPKLSLPTMRHRKVAPAFCSCTATQQSVRRRETPLVLLPAGSKPSTQAFYSNPPKISSQDSFIPKYTSTGISAEDLEETKSCQTTECTTLYITASAKRNFVAPIIELTDGSVTPRNFSYDEMVSEDTPTNFLTYTQISEDIQEDIQPCPVMSGQSKKSTLGRFMKRNLTRGRTFLRKMKKPRSLPVYPAGRCTERRMMKRSLPSMPGSFV